MISMNNGEGETKVMPRGEEGRRAAVEGKERDKGDGMGRRGRMLRRCWN